MVKTVGEPTVWLTKLHLTPEALKAEHPVLYASVYDSSPPGVMKINKVAFELLRSHTRMRSEKGSAPAVVKEGAFAGLGGGGGVGGLDQGRLLELALQVLRRQADNSDGIKFEMLGAGAHIKNKAKYLDVYFE